MENGIFNNLQRRLAEINSSQATASRDNVQRLDALKIDQVKSQERVQAEERLEQLRVQQSNTVNPQRCLLYTSPSPRDS